MSPLTTDNRDMAQIEIELRARIEAQQQAIETIRSENRRLLEENQRLQGAVNSAIDHARSGSFADDRSRLLEPVLAGMPRLN